MTNHTVKKMSLKTERQIKLLKRNKQNLIVDAALLLFLEEGYSGTSMQTIDKKVKISKGNLYNYLIGE